MPIALLTLLVAPLTVCPPASWTMTETLDIVAPLVVNAVRAVSEDLFGAAEPYRRDVPDEIA